MAKVTTPPQHVKQDTSVREIVPDETIDTQFIYNNKTEQEYLKYNQIVPDKIKFGQENAFLARVDFSKGLPERMVTQIIRTMWVDHDDPKKRRKDYVYYYENWYGKDWQGNMIPPVTDHIEGIYTSLIRVPLPPVQGKIVGYKTQTGPVIHYIPFDVKTVDEIINNSIGSDKDTIEFKIKTPTLRSRVENYDAFVKYSFKELEAEARKPLYAKN